jgi:predicted ATPase/class 3 adenylate cyclase/ubiquinone/menaquinone biosynthesis C-methylase UbiE
MAELPSGTVTFLFTDLEVSTRLWEQHPAEMASALALHDDLLATAVRSNAGYLVKRTGDGLLAAFETAHDAVAAALAGQLALNDTSWGSTGPLRVRMGLHTGPTEVRDGDYFGTAVNRAARLMASAHGGQVVCSQATADLVRDSSPERVALVDLGEHRLRDVSIPMQVFQVVHPRLQAEFPPLRSVDRSSGNLPRQVTTFVGRQREIAAVRAALDERPLVTLTGVGGVGKTRLALEVARDSAAEFRDGAWLCELAPVAGPDAFWEAVAGTFGLQRSPGQSLEATVLEYVAPKRLLIVLDNCEHLLNIVAVFAATMMQRCPDVAILATSREGLAIPGEFLLPVPTLDLPASDDLSDAPAGSDAVRLFVDRARDATADFTITRENTAAIAQICRRLDGIPLAIELAAARVRSIPPDELVARLDQRFKLLTRGSRAALERHQTLRSTIDWSYNLLDDAERTALDRLSVFPGTFDLNAAEAVVDDPNREVIDLLGQLVDKSMLLVARRDGGTRYRLLETIRQYAQDRLEANGDAAATRRRHADYYVALAEVVGPDLRTGNQLAAAATLDRESDNLRAALDWAADTDSGDLAMRLLAPLVATSFGIGWTATDWAVTACDIPGADRHRSFPHVCALVSIGLTLRSDLDGAGTFAKRAERAQAALGIDDFWVHTARGVYAMFRGDFDQAEREATTWLDLARRAGDDFEIAHALGMLGPTIVDDTERARAVMEEAVEVARRIGVPSILSLAVMILGFSLPPEESTRALALLDEAAELQTALGDRHGAANTINMRGSIAIGIQDWPAALSAAVEAADRLQELGYLTGFGSAVLGAAIALEALGEPEPATLFLGAAKSRGDLLMSNASVEMLAGLESRLVDTLGPERAAALQREGAGMDPTTVVTLMRARAPSERGHSARMNSGVPDPKDDTASVTKAGLVRLYDEIASTYGTTLDFFVVFGRDLVAAADIERGDHVLDIACGRGACLRPASEAIGEAGHVLGIDLSPEMVALLSQELKRDRVTNADVRVDDAERVEFTDGSFDAVTCGFGVHHFVHLVDALAGFQRALRPGGRFAASTFTDGTLDYPWVPEVLEETGVVSGRQRGRMRMLTAPGLAQALTEADFDAIATVTRRHRFVFVDVDAYMAWLRTQGPGTLINRLGPRDLERFEKACARRLDDHQARDGYELVKSVDLTVAVRPPRAP